jgi:hypothetical protein
MQLLQNSKADLNITKNDSIIEIFEEFDVTKKINIKNNSKLSYLLINYNSVTDIEINLNSENCESDLYFIFV